MPAFKSRPNSDNFTEFVGWATSNNILLSRNVLLAPFTTFKIGGPARYLAEVTETAELLLLCSQAAERRIPFRVLGNGSNVLISDSGFKGLVIINKCNHWHIAGSPQSKFKVSTTEPRFHPRSDTESELPEYDDSDAEPVPIIADSGIRLPALIASLFRKGLTGLQWFAGIPATVGGAVYMNAHGGPKFFGDFVHRAWLIDKHMTEKEVDHDYFRFDYDWSILHETKAVLSRVELVLRRGDVDRAAAHAKSWAKAKSFQPQRSAGCVFRNLTAGQMKDAGVNTSSAGFVIDKILGLKLLKCGDALISDSHAAFIENCGHASAADVVQLIETVQDKAEKVLGFRLQTEIEYIGF